MTDAGVSAMILEEQTGFAIRFKSLKLEMNGMDAYHVGLLISFLCAVVSCFTGVTLSIFGGKVFCPKQGD